METLRWGQSNPAMPIFIFGSIVMIALWIRGIPCHQHVALCAVRITSDAGHTRHASTESFERGDLIPSDLT